MEPLLAWVFLSVVVERMIEILVRLIPAIDDVKLSQLNIKLCIALVIGLLFSFGAGLDFFGMVNINFSIPFVGNVISGIFIMAGSNYISDLIATLNRVRKEPELEE